MLAPMWIGEYPPIYDYPNHLLEAQVVARYHDPELGYAAGYELRPSWWLESNALSTMLLIGLGRVVPITLTGRLVLSLYLLLFLGGFAFLTNRGGNRWLMLMAPLLAYNYAFTSGWINFSYGAALSLSVLGLGVRWQRHQRRSDLIMMAGLLLLIYIAHLVAWILVIVVFSSMLAVERWDPRRHGWAFLAMNGALPMLMVTRPALAALALIVSPAIWSGAALLRRSRISEKGLVLLVLSVYGLEVALLKVSSSTLNSLIAEVRFSSYEKRTAPLRLLALPHQTPQFDPRISGYNVAMLALLICMAVLLVGSSHRRGRVVRHRWAAPLGALGVLYLAAPTRTADLWYTEPRVLVFVGFVLLVGTQWPARHTWRWWLASSAAVMLFIGHSATTLHYAASYRRQTAVWSAELATLAPARSVLMLRGILAPEYLGLDTLGGVNTYYSGEHFVTTYALTHGGFVSRIFDSGPVRPRHDIPIPLYYWEGFDPARFVTDHCADLRRAYDAVLVWGVPGRTLTEQLDVCFQRGPQLPDLSIWRNQSGGG